MLPLSLIGKTLQVANNTPSYEEWYEAANLSDTKPERQPPIQDNKAWLPEGWVHMWDPASQIVCYSSPPANPPQSVWTHPYEDLLGLESQRHAVNAADSESGQDNALYAEKASGSPSRASSAPPNQGDSIQAFRSSPAQFHNDQYSYVTQPRETNFRKRRAGGIVRGVVTEPLNGRKYGVRQYQLMQDLSMQRRMTFQQNGGDVPATMAGPPYGGYPEMYAPPPVSYSAAGARRGMRRAAKRQATDQLVDAAVHGPPAPVTQFPQSPTYSYASGRLMY